MESGAGGKHGRLAGVDGGDDLGVVDALQVDGSDAEVGVPQLALDDVERDALVGEFDGVGVAQLVEREPPPHRGRIGRVAQPLVTRRAPGEIAGQGDGRATAAGGIQQRH
jgi:hypothetical protein